MRSISSASMSALSATAHHRRPPPASRRSRPRAEGARLRGQVPEGGHQAAQGSRGAARPLRLPGGALDPPPEHERHRIHLRHRPVADQEGQGRRQPGGRAGHGLQDSRRRPGSLAVTHLVKVAKSLGQLGRKIPALPNVEGHRVLVHIPSVPGLDNLHGPASRTPQEPLYKENSRSKVGFQLKTHIGVG